MTADSSAFFSFHDMGRHMAYESAFLRSVWLELMIQDGVRTGK